MYGTLARLARDEPETAILGVESLLAAGVLLGVALTLVSSLAPTLPLAHVGFTLAAAATLLLTAVSLVATSPELYAQPCPAREDCHRVTSSRNAAPPCAPHDPMRHVPSPRRAHVRCATVTRPHHHQRARSHRDRPIRVRSSSANLPRRAVVSS